MPEIIDDTQIIVIGQDSSQDPTPEEPEPTPEDKSSILWILVVIAVIIWYLQRK